MRVDICDSYNSEYDQFIQGIPTAKLCHLFAWAEMVQQRFGHKSYYLVARDNGAICGVLPLTQVRSKLFGNRMISQAFSNYGGPLTKTTASLDALCRRAVELATECRCELLELRNIDPIPYDLHLRTDSVCMHLSLPSDPDEIWKSFRPQIRNRIRKAKKSGIRVDSGGLELLDDFYHVWTIRMHQFGTPCYPRKLFTGIMETFPGKSRIFLVHMNGETIGVLFVYCFNDLVQCRWGAVLKQYENMCPNYLLFWSAMKYYCEMGVKCFDFGKSTVGSGQYIHKKRWGTKLIQLYYQYWAPAGHKPSLVRPDNPKYKNKVEAWKKLPLFMTRLIGPHISCNLP